jgi:hypothetical protein
MDHDLHKLITDQPESTILVTYVHKDGRLTRVMFKASELFTLCAHDEDYFGEVVATYRQDYQYKIRYYSHAEWQDKEDLEHLA